MKGAASVSAQPAFGWNYSIRQQAILNDAAEQLMEAGGLTALTQAHFNEAMKIVAQRFINAVL